MLTLINMWAVIQQLKDDRDQLMLVAQTTPRSESDDRELATANPEAG